MQYDDGQPQQDGQRNAEGHEEDEEYDQEWKDRAEGRDRREGIKRKHTRKMIPELKGNGQVTNVVRGHSFQNSVWETHRKKPITSRLRYLQTGGKEYT
jgi:hypothetical protein